MRIIAGPPVEGANYFPRPKIEGRFQQRLDNGESILLVAPRRVGKTSLVIRVCEELRSKGWGAVSFNVESCRHELDFAELLITNLKQLGLHLDLLTRLGNGFRMARETFGAKLALGGAGLSVEIDGEGGSTRDSLFRQIEAVFQKIESSGKQTVIAIDELPELLLNIARQENGETRVGEFLHWLRQSRQTYRSHLRWVLFGSIGLDHFVADQGQSRTINDLSTVSLDALSETEAHEFLKILSEDVQRPLAAELRQQIITKLGWPLPFHLQLIMDALVNLDATPTTSADVERAFAELVKPDFFKHFNTWAERIDDQFSKEDAAAAHGMLSHLCHHPKGRTRQQMVMALMASSLQADADALDQRIGKLQPMLQRDGYLLASGDLFAFRSFLLRDYWTKR